MSALTPEVAQLVSMLRDALAEHAELEGESVQLMHWRTRVSSTLDGFAGEQLTEVRAHVRPALGHNGAWHGLESYVVGGELLRYHLRVPLQAGDLVTFQGADDIPMLLMVDVVTGYDSETGPIITGQYLQLAVHCRACQRFGAAQLLIPSGYDGRVTRVCRCGWEWSQHIGCC